jgi:hypothetical protein
MPSFWTPGTFWQLLEIRVGDMIKKLVRDKPHRATYGPHQKPSPHSKGVFGEALSLAVTCRLNILSLALLYFFLKTQLAFHNCNISHLNG